MMKILTCYDKCKKGEFYKAVRGVQKENASVQVNAECIHSQSVQL